MQGLLFNPFDFANPVTNGDVFAGRKSQKDDVRYYLNHAKYTRPIHLALTGDRSAGKTSMLNMISQQASLLDFLVVRIDLNVGDAAPVQFFQRLYDAILMEVVRDGQYGGLTGRTWRAYRSLVDAGVDAPDLPLGFPAHIAAVMGGSRPLSIAVLQQDLIDIQAESTKKTVVVLDECDVLSTHPDTLQILRNLFTGLDRFMFVIAGTPQLFPVFDDVFSPIVRQFKKISIAPFEQEEETKACITQPLERMELDVADLIDNIPSLVEEVHQLTGGRPYEIQLLCHAMFRRVQDGSEETLVVNLEALDAVRKDLEHSQAHNLGRLSHLFGALSKSSLVAIQMIRRVIEGTAEAALAAAHLATPSWSAQMLPKETFLEQLEILVAGGILTRDGDKYTLAGDQFDEVYLRYLAASRGIAITSFQFPLRYLIERYLADALDAPRTQYPPNSWSALSPEQLAVNLRGMLAGTTADGSRHTRDFEWIAIYRAVKRAQNEGLPGLELQAFKFDVPGLKTIAYFAPLDDRFLERTASESYLEFAAAVEEAGGTLRIERVEIPLEGIEDIEVIAPKTETFLYEISDNYETDAYEAYEAGNYASASELFQTSFRVRPTGNAGVGCAFQALQLGKWEEAIEWASLSKSAPVSEESEYLRALADYDAAVANVMLGRLDKAGDLLESIKRSVTAHSAHTTLYLLEVERGTGGEWILEPTQEASIPEAAARLEATIAAQ